MKRGVIKNSFLLRRMKQKRGPPPSPARGPPPPKRGRGRPPKRDPELKVNEEVKRLTEELEKAHAKNLQYELIHNFQLDAARDANVELPDNWPAQAVIFVGNEIQLNIPSPDREYLSVFFRLYNVKKNDNVKIQTSTGRGNGCFACINFEAGTTIGVYAGHLRK